MMSDLMPEEKNILNALLAEALDVRDVSRIKACVEKGADFSAEYAMQERIYTPGRGATECQVRAPLSHRVLASGLDFTAYLEQIANYILGQGVDLDSRNDKGGTPLGVQIQRGNLSAVKWLLDNGASLKVKSESYLPIELAHRLPADQKCRAEIIDLILKKMPDVQASFNDSARKKTEETEAPEQQILVAPPKITVGRPKDDRPDDKPGLRF
jgi:hypothetical protein